MFDAEDIYSHHYVEANYRMRGDLQRKGLTVPVTITVSMEIGLLKNVATHQQPTGERAYVRNMTDSELLCFVTLDSRSRKHRYALVPCSFGLPHARHR